MSAIETLSASSSFTLKTGNNTIQIPKIGLGVWQSPKDVTSEVVYEALNIGYRHIDSAQVYKNEEEVGKGILKWLRQDPSTRKRSDIFYTTKVFRHGYESALKTLEQSFEKVKDLEYIDLVLVHNGRSNKKLRLETYAALQDYVDKGIVKSIGVSNFGIAAIKEILQWEGLKYKPTVNQVELHPFLVRQELTDYLNKEGITIEAYSPLTRGARLDDPTLARISKAHNKSVAQVLIRWSLERGYVSLPKTVSPSRLRENFNVFDFELTQRDLEDLVKLDENFIISPTFGDQIYWKDISDSEYEKSIAPFL